MQQLLQVKMLRMPLYSKGRADYRMVKDSSRLTNILTSLRETRETVFVEMQQSSGHKTFF